MYKPFEDLPKQSRVWIYQCNKAFSDQEVNHISEKLKLFLNNWKAHEMDVEASFLIKYNRFIIIAANQTRTPVSGCAIDTQVRLIQDIEKEYQVTLLDKMNVTYKEGNQINHFDLKELKKKIKSNELTASTTVFNNLVPDIESFEQYWEGPLEASWHSRFL